MDTWDFLATVNNAAINMSVQMSLQYPAFNSFGYRPRSGIAGSDCSSIFNFFTNAILFSMVLTSFYILTNSVQSLHSLANTCDFLILFCSVYSGYLNGCEGIFH